MGAAWVQDARLWDAGDRIHLTAEGHRRTALAAAAALGVPVAGDHTDWRAPPACEVLAQELAWVRGFVLPWIGRRLRGRSSGDGRAAKRPILEPVMAPARTSAG